MGCNCGKRSTPVGLGAKKGKRTNERFTLETRDGKFQSFGSRLEAEAQRVRSGGGTIRPA